MTKKRKPARKTPTKASIIKQVNECKERIAAERDKLRDLIYDAETVADSCDEATYALREAADSLSQYL